MPKPRRKKKPFIGKDEEIARFELIHRSQKDPLAADSDAPQRLLQPLPSREEVKKRKEEERNFGVFFDDEYDYMQHLKSRDVHEHDWDEVDKILSERPEKSGAASAKTNINLPSSVFASNEAEEDIGLLNKAAPHSGPLLDWDPDIVETLDDAFAHEVVYTLKDEGKEDDENELDMILASAKAENQEEFTDEEADDEYEDWDSDEAKDDVPSLEGGFSNFSAEETKSKFTSYSMSSSVIRRNDQLSLLDDKFEKFFDDYDEENMGGLALEDLEGHEPESSDVMGQILKEYEQEVATRRQKLDDDKVILNNLGESDDGDDDKEADLELQSVEEEQRDKFDCESIITTYSTLYNHPKLIKEPSIKPIKVSGKTGIPKDILGKGLTSHALKQLDRQNEMHAIEAGNSSSDEFEDDVETMTLASRVSALSFRNKHESKEEKKARKLAVKELKRERRVEKKANRDAFKDEKAKQEKNLMNNRAANAQAVKLI